MNSEIQILPYWQTNAKFFTLNVVRYEDNQVIPNLLVPNILGKSWLNNENEICLITPLQKRTMKGEKDYN